MSSEGRAGAGVREDTTEVRGRAEVKGIGQVTLDEAEFAHAATERRVDGQAVLLHMICGGRGGNGQIR